MSATESTAPAARTPRRQVVQFNSMDDVLRTAEYVFMSGNLPAGCDSKYKVFVMLLAGMEVGFGVSQSMSWITPPVNGRCNIYGDGGLALIRSSGLLEKFDERHEGDGDDRKAVVVIKRKGFPERAFEYPLSQAKKLKSYKVAQTKGGPWADDPDNMLQWRARWRAFRTEFTDILGGLGGAEEQEDDYITVDAAPTQRATAALPAAPPPASPPPALVDAQPVMSDEQFAEVKRLREVVRTALPDDGGAAEWAAMLADYHVGSAKSLTPDQAVAFIGVVGRKHDPFTYPPVSPPAAPTPGP